MYSMTVYSLGLQFDFAMEDVPERDPQQVSTAINDTSEVLNHLKKEMVCCMKLQLVSLEFNRTK